MQSSTYTALLGIPQTDLQLRLRGFHTLWPFFPKRSARLQSWSLAWSRNPERINPFGLGSSGFARHYSRNHLHFLFLGLLRCFTSPRSPSWTMNSSRNDSTLLLPDCSIRKSADRYLFAVTRSFSQLTTFFFASRLLGIHHLHLVA
jgi:hypothetical protein